VALLAVLAVAASAHGQYGPLPAPGFYNGPANPPPYGPLSAPQAYNNPNAGPLNNGPFGNAGDAQQFTAPNGKKGWVVKLGPQPLATPAIADGKLFIGGGFGSYEFYSYDARTGKKLWMYKTSDDGPTAAVVSDGYVAFNTESCELEIITMEGQKVWKKWLGDPLMSMPAIADGKLYMAYPNSKGDRNHYLACYDLRTGKDLWKQKIPGEIVTAPVVSKGNVYLTTLEGTVSCYQKDNGQLVFSEKQSATSSPMVVNGKLYYSQKEMAKVQAGNGQQVVQHQEKLVVQPTPAPLYGKGGDSGTPGGVTPAPAPVPIKGTLQNADYLDYGKRKELSGYYKANIDNDAKVGFATKPGDAKLHQAEANLGISNVSEVWAFQGSRPFVYKNNLYSTMGDTIKCVDLQTQDVVWTKKITHKGPNGLVVDSVVTPPAIANGKLFVGTHDGDVVCIDAASGKTLWTENVGNKIVFQPAVANGMVYLSTFSGHLYAIETGDRNDHGWLMWGGNAGHNGGVE
jgi:Ca-activated chloride channel family protein